MRDVLSGRRTSARLLREESAFVELVKALLAKGVPFAAEPCPDGCWELQYPAEYADYFQLQVDVLGVREGYPPEVVEG